MLLKSPSTPVLGSLPSSFSDSPDNNTNHYETKQTPPTIHHNHNKFSFYRSGSLNFSTVSCHSSPISPSIEHKGFRRAQSEGNLEGLLAYASCRNNEDRFYDSYQHIKFPGRPKCSMLQTIPSFSVHSPNGVIEYDEEEDRDVDDDEERENFEENKEHIERDVPAVAMAGTYYGLKDGKVNKVKFAEEVRDMDEIWNAFDERDMVGQEMYLAKGLGIGGGGEGGGGGSGREFSLGGSGGDEGDDHDIEEYYKKMVDENPGNPLFLRNYAQLLYQSNGDLRKAEEYYSRAILADPKDGEILSQYAKLTWELHHDQHRTTSYFERAVQASPEDSHVQAAYASFLWDTDVDDDNSNVGENLDFIHTHLRRETTAFKSA